MRTDALGEERESGNMLKRWAGALGVALLASGCAGDARPGAVSQVPVKDISFVLSSWGNLKSRWQIRADGSGEWTVLDQQLTVPPPRDTPPTVIRLPADPAHLAEIRALLAEAEAIAPKGLKCKKVITDAPYGSMEWNRVDGIRRINFDLGCGSKQADAVYVAFRKADDKMRGWAEAAKKGSAN